MIDIEKLKQAALEDVNSMGDYARMETGIAPIGTVNNLTNFINTVCTRLEAAESQLAAQELVIQQLRDALEKITQFANVQICSHDETYRGGNIWEICSQCGAKWSDDEGGKPEFVEPKQITEAIQALAIPNSTKHLEAWYKEMVGEPVAYQEYTEDGKSYYLVYSKQATKKQTPLHAIKPFPFKGE